MGIKFGDNTVRSIDFDSVNDVVCNLIKSWYGDIGDTLLFEGIATALYLAVLKGYSHSCLKKAEVISDKEEALCVAEENVDIVIVSEIPNDVDVGRKRINLSEYGIGDCTGYINEDKQAVVVCFDKNIESEERASRVQKIISVYHLIAPWINKNLLSPKNTSELSLQLRKYAKSLFTPSKKNKQAPRTDFYEFIKSEIKKQIEFSEIQKVLQNTIISDVTTERTKLVQEYERQSALIRSYIKQIKDCEDTMKRYSDRIKNLKDDEDELSNDVKAISSLLDSPNIEITAFSSECIEFKTVGLLTIFDPKIYLAVRNRSIVRRYSSKILDLFDKIFLDKTVTVKLISKWSWTGKHGIEAERQNIDRETMFPDSRAEAIQHPHIMGSGCLGNKTADIVRWNNRKEYDKVLGTILALNSNVNCGDGAVFPFFVKQVAEAYREGNTKIFYHKTDNGWEEGLGEEKDEQ